MKVILAIVYWGLLPTLQVQHARCPRVKGHAPQIQAR
jgi:hypothetical protein